METEGLVHSFEVRLRRHDGTVIWTQDSARAVRDSEGRVLYYEGSLEDITKRKQAEQELREHRDHLEDMVKERTAKIISDLLDFSRTRMPDREQVEDSELVAQVLLKRPPPEAVTVNNEIDPNLPPVYVDPRQIMQVLTNLVVNGYQAMPEGGELTISVQVRGDEVALSITDTGHGISEENLHKLFEPLFTTKAKGIGLGLAVSKNLLESNGGNIEVESIEGIGTTFTVLLPAMTTSP
jgi:signal transduction histidine kinase